jgi:hypothetical protein
MGIARLEKGQVILPDTFGEIEAGRSYEVIEIGGDILLMPPPLDRERLARIDRLARQSVKEHRAALEGLAR